jgi:hypothetical protein
MRCVALVFVKKKKKKKLRKIKLRLKQDSQAVILGLMDRTM